MGNGLMLLVIVGLLVGAYMYSPDFKITINSYWDKTKEGQSSSDVSSTSSSSSSSVSSNVSNSTQEIDPNLFSILGFPEKNTEFLCEFDRDCDLYYEDLCNVKSCVCLGNGKCAIKYVVVTENE